jgi:hypothetical protein
MQARFCLGKAVPTGAGELTFTLLGVDDTICPAIKWLAPFPAWQVGGALVRPWAALPLRLVMDDHTLSKEC